MTKMSPLLERNEQFAATYTPGPLGPPAAQVVIVTCLDHRVDPAIILGLRLGDAPVIRNAGGRVTPAVIEDIAYIAFLAEPEPEDYRGVDPVVEAGDDEHLRRGRA